MIYPVAIFSYNLLEMNQDLTLIKNAVHTIPNYPIEGILFRDVMGLYEVRVRQNEDY